MLHVVADPIEVKQKEVYVPAPADGRALIEIVEFLKRATRFMIVGGIVGAILAVVYLFTATPLFLGATTLIIEDVRKSPINDVPSILGGEASTDNSMIESQVEVLQSRKVALAVIDDLKLDQDEEFAGKPSLMGSVMGFISGLIKSDGDNSEAARRERLITNVLQTFQQRLSVTRVGPSYVLQINFLSESPAKAARIANEVAKAYINEALEAKYHSTERATVWLQARIVELRDKWLAADRASAAYKAENNIVTTNNGQADEQQVGELNSQLSTARGQIAETSAKLRQIDAVLAGGNIEGDVSDALKSDIINKLRQNYLDNMKRIVDWSRKYGANHQAVVNLQNENAQIRKSIQDELQRIAQSLKSEYEIAVAREKSIEQQLGQAVKRSAATDLQRVKLRELDANSEIYRSLYTNFLTRYTDGLQQQSFPNTEARVISEARPALKKSSPKTILTLALGLIAGAAAGTVVAFAREQLQRSLRTAEQLEQSLGLPCLGLLPVLAPKEVDKVRQRKNELVPSNGRVHYLGTGHPVSRFAILSPFSRFAETIRGANVAVDLRKLNYDTRIIGIVSSLAGEGKTTFASNIAFATAKSGKPTLLLDCDLRKPSLSEVLAPKAKAGLVQVLSGECALSDAVVMDRETNLAFLPAGVLSGGREPSSDILASEAFVRLMQQARESFAAVIVDLPPLALISDAKAISHIVDAFFLVVEWNRTPREVVQNVLNSSDMITHKICGAVLSKVDIVRYRQFSSLPQDYYDNSYVK